MWYNKINFSNFKNNNLFDKVNLKRPTIICYLLILFIATNLVHQKTSKINLLLVMSIGLGIFYFNTYLGLFFLSLLYVQTILIKKENFRNNKYIKKKGLENFQNNNNNSTNNNNNSTNGDDKLNYFLSSFLTVKQLNQIQNTTNNYTLEDLIYTNNLDEILSNTDNNIMATIISFRELSKIYLLDYQKIVFLIKNNIKTIEDINNNIELLDDIHKIGLDYYNDLKVLTDEHYLILYNLYFDNDLFENTILTKDNISNTNVIDILENYKKIDFIKKYIEKNEILKKLLIESLILLEYYDILDKGQFTPINVIKTIQNLSITTVSDNIFELLNLKHRATIFYSNYLKKNIQDKKNNVDWIDYSTNTKVKDENADKQKNLKTELLNKEYKELKIMDDVHYGNVRKDVDFKNIITDFSNTMIDIIEELIGLFNQEKFINSQTNKLNIDNESSEKSEESEDSEDSEENNTKNTYFDTNAFKKYIFYFKEIIHIFTKNGRMFHTGILLLFISIIIYFVDSTK